MLAKVFCFLFGHRPVKLESHSYPPSVVLNANAKFKASDPIIVRQVLMGYTSVLLVCSRCGHVHKIEM